MNSLMKYSYYDTPEGHSFFPKLFYTTKLATAGGLIMSTYDVLTLSRPKNYAAAAGRYICITGPVVGMAAAFTSITYISTKMRNKDDLINYLVGGIAAACVYGTWYKSIYSGFNACFFLGGLAMIKKHAVMNGYDLFPEPKAVYQSGAWLKHNDYTLTRERPKNWTSNPNEA